ncbi:hypothetical protein WA158_006369 [Blastocystis sp. Blastoise]
MNFLNIFALFCRLNIEDELPHLFCGKLDLPKNHEFMKTRVHNELSPLDDDWYYVRAAAIARRVYLRPGCGVGALREVFGSKKDNGVRKGHFAKATGGIIRHCMHNLEKLGLMKVSENGDLNIFNYIFNHVLNHIFNYI